MELKVIPVEIPKGCNIIIGQAHFIKSAEDLFEAVSGNVPGSAFGVAFCEASNPCLIRVEGTDEAMKDLAVQNATAIGAGHVFVIMLKEAFPINVLNAVKSCQEVCSIFCATANQLQVIVAETEQGRGVLGVVDGFSPKGVETPEDKKVRREFLRIIGYKL